MPVPFMVGHLKEHLHSSSAGIGIDQMNPHTAHPSELTRQLIQWSSIRKKYQREKLILTGLYLSRYDGAGLRKLGFESFVEAFNVIGYALGQKPASIKNYRDEFDPLFPNKRRGWHKRPTRDYCLKVFTDYKTLDLNTVHEASSNRSLATTRAHGARYDPSVTREMESQVLQSGSLQGLQPSVTSNLLFRRSQNSRIALLRIPLSWVVVMTSESTTKAGATSWRWRSKGLKTPLAASPLTPKEHEVASALVARFFLFVVKNFRESPYHEIYPNPLASDLRFKKKERVIVHTFLARQCIIPS